MKIKKYVSSPVRMLLELPDVVWDSDTGIPFRGGAEYHLAQAISNCGPGLAHEFSDAILRYVKGFRAMKAEDVDAILDSEALRARALVLLEQATNGGTVAYHGDPIFEEVTEGRQKWPKYSACGDLPHWMLMKLGYKNEEVMNRSDDGGDHPWAIGRNLSRIVFGNHPAFRWWREHKREVPLPGDVLYLSDHVAVLGEFWKNATARGRITLYEYGQFQDGKHCGCKRERKFSPGDCVRKKPAIGQRNLDGWLSLHVLMGVEAKTGACEA